jgi:hypothetical protein
MVSQRWLVWDVQSSCLNAQQLSTNRLVRELFGSGLHPLACGRVGLSGPGRALHETLSAAETATLPKGE